MLDAQSLMNDYRQIRPSDDSRLRIKADDFLEAHEESMVFLKEELQKSDMPTVVVTHNAPSSQSSEEQYKSTEMAPAFATNLEGFIEEHSPKLWIHGHMHNNSDYMVGETRVLCNPRGYAGINVNPEFDETLVVEV
jgi:Icc-related predicted phosphoesterase